MSNARVIHQARLADQIGTLSGTAASATGIVLRTDALSDDLDVIGWRHSDFRSLYIVRRGRGEHVIDHVPFAIARGDVYAMEVGQTHWFTRGENLVLDTVHFRPEALETRQWAALSALPGYPAATFGGRWLHLTPAAHALLSEQIAELRDEWRRDDPTACALVPALLFRLLVRLARQRSRYATSDPVPAGREETVAAALRYVDEHFAEPLRIEQIARRVFLSPDRFTEVFAAAMGRTPRDYLKHVRLEHAKALLTSTDLSVAQIGLRAGFSDPAYFARTFKAETGKTPRQWRQQRSGP